MYARLLSEPSGNICSFAHQEKRRATIKLYKRIRFKSNALISHHVFPSLPNSASQGYRASLFS